MFKNSQKVLACWLLLLAESAITVGASFLDYHVFGILISSRACEVFDAPEREKNLLYFRHQSKVGKCRNLTRLLMPLRPRACFFCKLQKLPFIVPRSLLPPF